MTCSGELPSFRIVVDMQTALKGARILLVDDHAEHLRTLDRTLRAEGCEVIQADSVPAALEVISAEDTGFGAAIVDYKLGMGRTGAEVVEALRTAERFTASVILTGEPSREIVADVFKSGVHTMLTKPVTIQKLLPEVAACIAKTDEVRRKMEQADQHHYDESTPPVVPGSDAPAKSIREERVEFLTRRGGLSDREREVLHEVFTGLKNADIAGRLGIAERTVKFHISNINRKLSVRHRGELMALLASDPTPSSAVPTPPAAGESREQPAAPAALNQASPPITDAATGGATLSSATRDEPSDET